MNKEVNFFTKLHTKTSRKYIDRMVDDKISCMRIAKEYGFDYWDGDRRYGYGGYKYDGRWKETAREIIEFYNLDNNSKILDVGCGKAFLIFEIQKLLPGIKVVGFDISEYAIENAKQEIKSSLFVHNAKDIYPFGDKEFDLAFSLGVFHNLKIYELRNAVKEIERVSKQKYIMVEAYRDEAELFNLECWALTCESFFRPDEWVWLYNEFGYTGDFEFIYFE